MKIKIYNRNEILLTCKYVWLNPFAPTTLRALTFYEISEASKEKLQQFEVNDAYLEGDEFKINIDIYDKSKRRQPVYEFKLRLKEYITDVRSLTLFGLIYDDYGDVYKQGVIDVFNLWTKKKQLNWFELPVNSPTKSDYLLCCMMYSGLSKHFIKEYFQINMSLVQEDVDFIYLASLEFVGVKGYFGHNLYTFEDCLLEIYHNRGFSEPKKMRLFNVGEIINPQIINLYREIKGILGRFNFIIETDE